MLRNVRARETMVLDEEVVTLFALVADVTCDKHHDIRQVLHANILK